MRTCCTTVHLIGSMCVRRAVGIGDGDMSWSRVIHCENVTTMRRSELDITKDNVIIILLELIQLLI